MYPTQFLFCVEFESDLQFIQVLQTELKKWKKQVSNKYRKRLSVCLFVSGCLSLAVCLCVSVCLFLSLSVCLCLCIYIRVCVYFLSRRVLIWSVSPSSLSVCLSACVCERERMCCLSMCGDLFSYHICACSCVCLCLCMCVCV